MVHIVAFKCSIHLWSEIRLLLLLLLTDDNNIFWHNADGMCLCAGKFIALQHSLHYTFIVWINAIFRMNRSIVASIKFTQFVSFHFCSVERAKTLQTRQNFLPALHDCELINVSLFEWQMANGFCENAIILRKREVLKIFYSVVVIYYWIALSHWLKSPHKQHTCSKWKWTLRIFVRKCDNNNSNNEATAAFEME